MTDPNEVAKLIKASIADAVVVVEDMTGTADHFQIRVVSNQFKGKMLIDQHRMVQAALKTAMDDGRIHAIHLTTRTPEEQAKRPADDDFKVVH